MSPRGFLALVFSGLVSLPALAFEQISLNPTGPDPEKLGQSKNFPACPSAHTKPECRVGAWSASERVGITSVVRATGSPMPLPLMKNPPQITFQSGGAKKTIDEYLASTKVTGLMILKEGQVVLERYQYDRKPEMRFRSFSMAKTFTAMLVGIAHQKGFVRSLDDKAAACYFIFIVQSGSFYNYASNING